MSKAINIPTLSQINIHQQTGEYRIEQYDRHKMVEKRTVITRSIESNLERYFCDSTVGCDTNNESLWTAVGQAGKRNSVLIALHRCEHDNNVTKSAKKNNLRLYGY